MRGFVRILRLMFMTKRPGETMDQMVDRTSKDLLDYVWQRAWAYQKFYPESYKYLRAFILDLKEDLDEGA